MKRFTTVLFPALFALVAHAAPDAPKGLSVEEEMARKMADPLADIKALFTDNAFEFNTGPSKGLSYNVQLQPVYAVPFEKQGFNFITRAVLPFMGLEPGAQKPIVDQPVPEAVFGLGDTSLQFFFNPRTRAAWKWGAGPMFTLPTATDSALKGPGWGAGAAGVVVGNFTEQLSFAGLGGQVWGRHEGYSTAFFQPMLYYNLSAIPGATLHYNNMISYNWNASANHALTLPLGFGVSQMIAVGEGHGVDLSVGAYYNVERPEGAADWIMKWSVSWLLP